MRSMCNSLATLQMVYICLEYIELWQLTLNAIVVHLMKDTMLVYIYTKWRLRL